MIYVYIVSISILLPKNSKISYIWERIKYLVGNLDDSTLLVIRKMLWLKNTVLSLLNMLSKIGNLAKVFCICTLLLSNLTGFYLVKIRIEKDSVLNIHCLVLTSFEKLCYISRELRSDESFLNTVLWSWYILYWYILN